MRTGMESGMTAGWKTARRGFAAQQVKMVIAGVFAVAGIGYGAYVVFGGKTGEQPERAAAPAFATSVVDAEGNPAEALYLSTRGEAAGEIVSQIGEVSQDLARGIQGFSANDPAAREGLDESVQLAVGGLFSGDHDAFLAAMEALGAKLDGDLEGQHPMFVRLAQKLEGAEVDVSRIVVQRHESRRGGPSALARAREMNEEAEERADGETRGEMRVNIMEMQPASLFPDASGQADERAIDVQIPFLAKGADDEDWFGLVLVWNPEARHWQPSAFQMIQKRYTERREP